MGDGPVSKICDSSIIEESACSIVEIVLDAVVPAALDVELLKDIPFVSLLAKTFQLGTGIRDRLFLRKLQAFFVEAGRISTEKRTAFRNRLANEPELAGKCGESVLLLLEKLADLSKAQLMGFAFRRFVEGQIDDVVLHRIYDVIELLPLSHIVQLPKVYFEHGLGSTTPDCATSFQSLGLVDTFYGAADKRLHTDLRRGQSFFLTYHQPFYRATDIGTAVAEVVRDYLAQFKEP